MPLPSLNEEVMEIKGFETSFELKASDDKEGSFEGHAAVFNKADEFGDVIMPGAFKKSLRSHKKVKMFHEHQRIKLLGVWEQLKEDSTGLFVKGQLLMELPAAQEALILLKAGVLDSLSIGFRTVVDEFDSKKNTRNIVELKLFEVSLVSIPAQAAALITNVKNVSPEDIETRTDLERVLRDVGISKSTSKFICAGWTPPPARRDVEGGTELVKGMSALAKTLRTATGAN